ncbi:MAG: hypothetical protein ABJ275_11735 [Maricaulaceae bacterium]
MIGLPTLKFLRIYLLATSFCLLNNCSPTQDVDLEPVEIPLINIANNKAEVTYTHRKLKNGKGREGKITAVLEIESKSDEGFIASWTSKSVQVDGVLIDESSEQAGSMLLGVPLNFLTGSDGGPIKLLNREKLFAELPNSVAFANSDAETVEQVMNFYKSMDEDTIANVFFKIPSFMSVCQDTNFIVGETNYFPTEQPSPFGEGVLMGNVSYKLTSLDSKNNIANIEYRTEFDQESLKQLAIQSVKTLAPDMPVSQSDIDDLMMDRKDSADCKVDMSTGWVTKIKYSTMVSASGETNEEIFDVSINWIQ